MKIGSKELKRKWKRKLVIILTLGLKVLLQVLSFVSYNLGLFSSKTDKQKRIDKLEIEELTERKQNEFNAKFGEDAEDLNQQEGLFEFEGAPSDMPNDWVKFHAYFTIPTIILKLKGIQENDDKVFVKLETSGLELTASIGDVFQKANIKLGSLNIIDLIHKNSRYSHLTHTKMDEGTINKQAIEIEFDRNIKRYNEPIKISLETKAQQYVVANFLLIHALQEFFKDSQDEDDINLDYYKKLAADQTLQFIQQGQEYVETVSTEASKTHESIHLSIDFSTPIIVIPEVMTSNDKDREAMIFNIGRLTASTKLTKYDKYKNYKIIESPDKLYDEYTITFEGFRLTNVRKIENYEHWEKSKDKIDIIKNIMIVLEAKRCIEPAHPTFPQLQLT